MFRPGGILASGKRAVIRVIERVIFGDTKRRIRQLSKSVAILEREIKGSRVN